MIKAVSMSNNYITPRKYNNLVDFDSWNNSKV